jgi:putative transposase
MTTLSAAPVSAAAVHDEPTIWRVDDVLWSRLAPLLVVDKPRKKPGRPRHDDRTLFNGILWHLRTGAQWTAMPPEFGPKSTVHARFQEWVQTGAFARAWTVLLDEYAQCVGLDLHWQAADGCLVKAPLGKKGGREKPKRPDGTPPTAARVAPSDTC